MRSLVTALLFCMSIFTVDEALSREFTIPNTFQSNTTAKASEVNANFTAAKIAIDDNNSGVLTNENDISTLTIITASNSSNVSINTSDIGNNSTAISQNQSAIGINTTGINSNSSSINQNTSDISQNTANIAASASDITDNTLSITTNRTDIDANTAAISGVIRSLQVLSNGMSIGSYIGSKENGNGIWSLRRADEFIVLSSTEYLFSVSRLGAISFTFEGLELGAVAYEGANCVGPEYLVMTQPFLADQGIVFLYPFNNSGIKYIAKGTPVTNIFEASRWALGSGCTTASNGIIAGYAISPHDQAITGVPTSLFATPITLGY